MTNSRTRTLLRVGKISSRWIMLAELVKLLFRRVAAPGLPEKSIVPLQVGIM